MSFSKMNRLGVSFIGLPSRYASWPFNMTAEKIFSKNPIRHTDLSRRLHQLSCYSTCNDKSNCQVTANNEGLTNNDKNETEIEVSSLHTQDGILKTSVSENSKQTDMELQFKNVAALKKIPEPPVYCCGTGCGKCVWMIYADELKEYYKDDLGKFTEGLNLDQIEDPSVRMFLKMELGLK